METKYLDWLKSSNGCVIKPDGSILTPKGDYVGLATLDKCELVEFLYNNNLTQLQSLKTALGGNNRGTAICLGFNEDKQEWYGFTHRGHGHFGIGFVAEEGFAITEPHNGLEVPVGFVCNTLDDCKRCAIAMADYLD